jgi:hypothetical protein
VSAVAAPAPPREAIAHRPEPCVLCGEGIEQGDPIRPLACPKVWVHTQCAKDYDGDGDFFDDDNTYGVESASEESIR